METTTKWFGACSTAAVMAVALSGCASFRVGSVQSKLPNFVECMETPRGVCKVQALADLMRSASPSDLRGPYSIATAPRSAFVNPFDGTVAARAAAAACPNTLLDRSAPSSIATLSEGVIKTKALLEHPFQRSINAVHSALQGSPGATASVSISRKDLEDYVALATDITNTEGWSAYRSAAICNYSFAPGVNATDEDVRRAVFMEAYLKAYFRNGEFGNIEFEAADLFKKFPELDQLQEPLKTQLKNAVDALAKKAVFGKIGAASFITRTGTTYQIAPIQITIDPTKKQVVSVSDVNYTVIASDLVRVVLEAIFDGRDVLPAVTNASGVTANIKYVTLPPKFQGLDVFDSKTMGITKEQFDRATSISNGVEASASSGASQLIRGAGPVALNNETLAKMIEAAIGVAARKVTEKASYCWFACKLDTTVPSSIQAATSEPPFIAERTTVTVNVSFY